MIYSNFFRAIICLVGKRSFSFGALSVGVISMAFLISFVALAAWTEPTQTPTGGNAAAPLNVSSTGQGKLGSLGVGLEVPVSRFHVKGGQSWGSDLSVDATGLDGGRRWLLIATAGDASEGQGKFLIKDNNAPAVRLIIDTSGNVGIGTTDPGSKLEVFNPSGASVVKVHSDWDIASINIDSVNNSYGAGINLLYGGVQTWFIGMPRLTPSSTDSIYFSTSQSGTGAKLVITSAGNVGIGTTAPVAKLEVAGQVKITGGTPGVGKVLTSDATGLASWQTVTGGGGAIGGSGTANQVAFFTAASNLSSDSNFYWDNTNKRLGIGTTTPLSPFHIKGTSGVPALLLEEPWGDISFTEYVDISTQLNNTGMVRLWTRTGGTDYQRLVISNSGNVGIGTTAPGAKLDVRGDIYIGFDNASTNSFVKSFTTGHAAGNVPSQLFVGINDGTLAGMYIKNVRDGSFNSQSIEFATHHGGVTTGTRMTIDKDGNVGIGTTAPGAKLDVVGPIRNSAPSEGTVELSGLLPGRADNTYPTVKTSGSNLYFSAGGKYSQRFYSNGSILQLLNDAAMNYINTSGNSYLMGGNVGIGTTNPLSKLGVKDQIRISRDVDSYGYVLNNEDGGNRLDIGYMLGVDTWYTNSPIMTLIATGGNVGIGTIDPGAYKLKVNGDGNVTGNLTINGTIIAGGSGNPYPAIKTRHIDGKAGDSTADDDLFLNYATGKSVHVGGPGGGWGQPANLIVEGHILQKTKTLFFTKTIYTGDLKTYNDGKGDALCSAEVPGAKMASLDDKAGFFSNPDPRYHRGWIKGGGNTCLDWTATWGCSLGGEIGGCLGTAATIDFGDVGFGDSDNDSVFHEADNQGRNCEDERPIICIWE